MNDQRREHEEYEAGRFANEHQAAFALSRSEYVCRDDSKLIDRLLGLGFYAVVEYVEKYCVFTDAVLAVETYVIAAFRKYESAVEFSEGLDYDHNIMGIRPYDEQVPEEDPSDDDIPF